jgi:hypothetical protein
MDSEEFGKSGNIVKSVRKRGEAIPLGVKPLIKLKIKIGNARGRLRIELRAGAWQS